jgi:hypothetical protein
MSTIKISQLPALTSLTSNTQNTLFIAVDLPTSTTGKLTGKTLAQGLFANEVLNVGNNAIVYPDVIGQFAGSSNSYLQINLQNFNSNGSSDFVASASDATDTSKYIDIGINGGTFNDANYSAFKPYDGYIYVYGASSTSANGNLIVGTASTRANIVFIAGGLSSDNIVGRVSNSVFDLLKPVRVTGNVYSSTGFVFSDGTYQTTAGPSVASLSTANTFLQSNDFITLTSSKTYTDTSNTYAQTTLLAKTGGTITGSLIVTGNITANSVGTSISVDNFSSNSATFSRNVIILGNLTANTLQGNVFFSNITTGTSQANSIQWFALSTSPVQTSGQVWYSSNTISLVQDTDVAGDRPSISKVLFERVYNGTGSTIAANSWVRLAGAVTSNSVPYITLADATSAANSIVEGFVKVGIPSGGYGFLYTKGIVDDLDASSFGNNGQIIFLSTTPGRATNVAPTGANSVFQVAKILSNGSANGKIQIDIAARQAYGKPNGAILFANNNLIQASNVAIIDEANSTIYVPNGLLFNTRDSSINQGQSTITLNFTTDTWVRTNVGSSLVVTLANYKPGSDITLFMVNANTGGGSTRTITHGCSAINSSIGTTTFTLGGTTTARIKYYSFGGDNANTYCSISYS